MLVLNSNLLRANPAAVTTTGVDEGGERKVDITCCQCLEAGGYSCTTYDVFESESFRCTDGELTVAQASQNCTLEPTPDDNTPKTNKKPRKKHCNYWGSNISKMPYVVMHHYDMNGLKNQLGENLQLAICKC